MNIEKTECERIGYKYIGIFECLLSFIHHTPFANEFINNNALKELEELHLKLYTGDMEIIEFGRKICEYDIEDRIQEKDKEIKHLQNLIDKATNYYLKTLAKNGSMPDEAVEMFNLLEENK